MQITIATKELNEALSKVSKTLPSNSSRPVLDLIKVCTTDSSVVLTTCNGEFMTEYSISDESGSVLTIEKNGSVLIPAILIEMVKKLGTGVKISVNNGNQIKITSVDTKIKSVFELMGMETDEYPQTPKLKGKPILTIKGNELVALINNTKFAASTAEATPVLNGINMNIVEGVLTFNATDRHRLARSAIAVDTKEELGNGRNVPAKAFDALSKIIHEDEEYSLFLQDNFFMVTSKQLKYKATLIEGVYPDLSRIVPPIENSKATFKAHRVELINALERVNIMKEKTPTMLLSLQESGSLVLETDSSGIGKVHEEIFIADQEGEALKMSLNTDYVLKALKAINTTMIEIHLTGEMSPFVIYPENNKLDLQLILPYRRTV
ncbi:DNA polymerase III subunit beta [Paenibacillus sp. VTT E-133291]|uniref:DNA polymerase III subunit beta n=1 Tax=Paenibacillus sp. VTT E-133291 TaxID=1986223 RepID=UPI000BA13B1B|nr:DNA polymerase III subunit beta [Paenibacillus sp. VTT E-133291]OZQ97419.1 DNA polymerase III subunit beta [Paenibacillus sp. VTT E-133291]